MTERKHCCQCGKRHNSKGDKCRTCCQDVDAVGLDNLDQLWRVLEETGPITRPQLARLAGLDSRRIQIVIDRLENNGYLTYLDDNDNIGAAWRA